jgi:hypothetical protein
MTHGDRKLSPTSNKAPGPARLRATGTAAPRAQRLRWGPGGRRGGRGAGLHTPYTRGTRYLYLGTTYRTLSLLAARPRRAAITAYSYSRGHSRWPGHHCSRNHCSPTPAVAVPAAALAALAASASSFLPASRAPVLHRGASPALSLAAATPASLAARIAASASST